MQKPWHLHSTLSTCAQRCSRFTYLHIYHLIQVLTATTLWQRRVETERWERMMLMTTASVDIPQHSKHSPTATTTTTTSAVADHCCDTINLPHESITVTPERAVATTPEPALGPMLLTAQSQSPHLTFTPDLNGLEVFGSNFQTYKSSSFILLSNVERAGEVHWIAIEKRAQPVLNVFMM